MAPIVSGLQKKYEKDVAIQVIDVDLKENKELCNTFQVRSIPAFVFIDKNGNLIDRVEGGMPEADFESKIKDLMSR